MRSSIPEEAQQTLERYDIRLGPFFCPGRSAARVLRAGVHSTLHGVVFAIFCPSPAFTAEGALCRVRDTRSLVPRVYGTNRSNSNTSCSSGTSPRKRGEVQVHRRLELGSLSENRLIAVAPRQRPDRHHEYLH